MSARPTIAAWIGYLIHHAARALGVLAPVQRAAQRVLDRMDPTP